MALDNDTSGMMRIRDVRSFCSKRSGQVGWMLHAEFLGSTPLMLQGCISSLAKEVLTR